MSAKEKNTGTIAPEAQLAAQVLVNQILARSGSGTSKGIASLARLPEFDLDNGVPAPVPGQDAVQQGVLAFRRNGGEISLAVACGTAMVQSLPLDKFVAMVERMHDDDRTASIVIQNHRVGDRHREESRGQIVGRINPLHTAIQIIHGVHGRAIKSASDIAQVDIYYLDRAELAVYYLAAKLQIGADDRLEEMIAAFEGWKGYAIPLNPLGAAV